MKTAFKMTLAAAAAALAMTSVQAASVSLYGSISTGVVVTGTDKLTTAGAIDQDRTTTTSMENAWYGDSIWGLTGEEELGNGWKVGFTLENSYESDTGALDGDLFGSQAYLKVTNDVVTVAAGNIGALDSAGGDFDLVGGFDPLEAAFGVGGMGAFATRDATYTNAFVLSVAPVDGLTVSAMGSFGDDDSTHEWDKNDHYYALGALYENGPLAVGLTGSMNVYDAAKQEAGAKAPDNSYAVTFGASWDFEVVKPMFMYQHTDKNQAFQDVAFTSEKGIKADSFLLGATAPLGNGSLMASAQYLKITEKTSGDDGKAFILGVAYAYNFSERTALYMGATYAQGGDGLDKDLSATDPQAFKDIRGTYNGYQFGVGLNHTF